MALSGDGAGHGEGGKTCFAALCARVALTDVTTLTDDIHMYIIK